MNATIVAALDSSARKRKRGPYHDCPAELKLKIARYAIDTTATKAARAFETEVGYKLNESTVRSWKKKYEAQLRKVQ